MQGARISSPVEVHDCLRGFGGGIVRLDSQGAIQHRFFFRIACEITITQRELLKRVEVARLSSSARSKFCMDSSQCPYVCGCNQSAQKSANHWAGSYEQCPVQPERHCNRGTPSKDSVRVPDASRPRPDAGQRLLRGPLRPRQGAPTCGHSHKNEADHELKRSGNTHGKTKDHAPQPH